MALLAVIGEASADGLTPAQLAVLYNADDPTSRSVALFYAARRAVPADNVLPIALGNLDVMTPERFEPARRELMGRLPSAVESLALVWSHPYAVGCMSVTTAFAAGYRTDFCRPGCVKTPLNPLFASDGWLPADTVGWWPAMLLPTDDPNLAHTLIERGIAADGTRPRGTVYLVRTGDIARNVRAATYSEAREMLSVRLHAVELGTPIERDVPDVIGYFTGTTHVEELTRVHFLPGAVADHLTSVGGVLRGGSQMSALAWLAQGATASYGSVSEPCNFLSKFPDIAVLMQHYLRGETVLEAYWKSVHMPGQGLFIGEPLARPFAGRVQ
jgi:uncharacterized protein (TIGR03790 family)